MRIKPPVAEETLTKLRTDEVQDYCKNKNRGGKNENVIKTGVSDLLRVRRAGVQSVDERRVALPVPQVR